eukprot:gene5501-5556_t
MPILRIELIYFLRWAFYFGDVFVAVHLNVAAGAGDVALLGHRDEGLEMSELDHGDTRLQIERVKQRNFVMWQHTPLPPGPSQAVPGLVLQLLAWVARSERSYDETMEAWRTSCPRLSVWEDAVDGGLVVVDPAGVAG